ncbi:MAG: two-component sensor histidine kinase [Gammaproteobacteria bacterium]|nr:MAG: two-component sensor histidine kinase [Gammaproteobacteria bacterium]
MIHSIRQMFSSIGAKLFFWFWLVAIVSVVSTHLISSQLTDQHIIKNNVVLPIHHPDMRQLDKIVRYHNFHQSESVNSFLNKFRKSKRKNRNIWLKDPQKQQVFSVKKKANKQIKKYLLENNIKQPLSVKFQQVMLTGPVKISINDHNYQLFITMTRRHEPPLFFVPLWLRISIPLVISFILLWLLARSLSKPILKIQQAANKLGNGDLTTRVTQLDQRNDELGQLASSFNHMAEKLSNSISAQQRLLADVSHELRSPMTRLQLAVALAHKSAKSPEELEKYLLRCETEIGRLDDMLGNVITLSRLENTLPNFNSSSININKLIDDLVADAQFIANEKDIKITFADQHKIITNGDEQLLASALGNILTNAVKYSPENSEVKVNITSDQEWLKVEISDSGAGVPEQALAKLFQPFYRVQDDRARKTGGSGLGLAIAKQAILAHHGSIEAYNNTQGLTVVIKLPNG